MDGILVIDKPQRLTSHDVVARMRRLLGTRRVGHLGTLDPMATGVLPLVIGRATRLVPFFSTDPKIYEATIKFGVETDTYDLTGRILSRESEINLNNQTVTRKDIEVASQPFRGTFFQQPPPFSAKKINGVRAYRLARQKKIVKPRAVEVNMYKFEIHSLKGDQLNCRVTCSTGFYMRSLAHDLGAALGCGGCIASLRRKQSGIFNSNNAVKLDVLEREERNNIERRLVPLAKLLPELPSVIVTEQGCQLVAHGNVLSSNEIKHQSNPPHPFVEPSITKIKNQKSIKIYNQRGMLLAIAEMNSSNVLHPKIVLV